jgi:4-amino-4-deoxy-L-arabinose transferase-like glycosyltransferase
MKLIKIPLSIDNKFYRAIFIFYVIVLFLSCFTIIPYVDSYYYWLWSTKLQMSYLDGPPLIGYVIKLSTLIFNNSIFAINFVGFAISIISSIIILNICTILFQTKRYSFKIMLLWLSSYIIVGHRIMTFVTYDGLENLFELLVILATLKYFDTKKIKYLYQVAFFAGFSLLSKYSAIIIIIGILLFFIYKKSLRHIFKSYHIYLIVLLCSIIFSPVLIWNIQHKLASFTYQLTFHNFQDTITIKTLIDHVMSYIVKGIISPLIPIILILVIIKFKKNQLPYLINNQISLNFMYTIIITIFTFWLLMSTFASIPDRYLLLMYSLIFILIGYLLLVNNYEKLFFIFLLYNLSFSIGDIISHSLVVRNPYCSKLYIDNGLLKFNSPLKDFITIKQNASNFCYEQIRQ